MIRSYNKDCIRSIEFNSRLSMICSANKLATKSHIIIVRYLPATQTHLSEVNLMKSEHREEVSEQSEVLNYSAELPLRALCILSS